MMKKIIGLAAVSLLLLTSIASSYAEATNTQPSQQSASTKVDTSKQPANQGSADNQQNSGSVYESIRSGWNKFIDLLAGPKQ